MDIFLYISLSNLATGYGIWFVMRRAPERIKAEAYEAMVRSLTPADQHWLRKNNGNLEVVVEKEHTPVPPKGGFNTPPVRPPSKTSYRVGGYVEASVTNS